MNALTELYGFAAQLKCLQSLRQDAADRAHSKSLSEAIRRSLLLLSNPAQWESVPNDRLRKTLRARWQGAMPRVSADQCRGILLGSVWAKFCFVKGVGLLLRCFRLMIGLIGIVCLAASQLVERVIQGNAAVGATPSSTPAPRPHNLAKFSGCKYPPLPFSFTTPLPSPVEAEENHSRPNP
jgi:hypothetical protein